MPKINAEETRTMSVRVPVPVFERLEAEGKAIGVSAGIYARMILIKPRGKRKAGKSAF